MRPGDQVLAQSLKQSLQTFDQNVQSLPGIATQQNLDCLVRQLIDSIRRVKYITTIKSKQISSIYADATSPLFDPLKGAIWHHQNGNIDEAFWLVFLATHFGKNKRTGWELARGTYGAMGQAVFWDWVTTSSNPPSFRAWLHQNQNNLKSLGNFSNHRKYQSIDATSATGTGAAVESYITWVGAGGHQALITSTQNQNNLNARQLFDALYNSMNAVASFGRTARFDYLTMIGKLGLATIEPASTYMAGSTGPKTGAKLLFYGRTNAPASDSQLNSLLNMLDQHLNLYFGMQILEDSLCNWQKSPGTYRYFGG